MLTASLEARGWGGGGWARQAFPPRDNMTFVRVGIGNTVRIVIREAQLELVIAEEVEHLSHHLGAQTRCKSCVIDHLRKGDVQ